MNTYFTGDSTWCWLPDVPAAVPCFALFRKRFSLDADGCEIRVDVSGDNRYNLFLDGRTVGRGPCRSDLHHYNYETYTIPVSPGDHVLSAEVVVYQYGFRGQEGPIPEMHAGSAFIMGGGVYRGDEQVEDLSTPADWKCLHDTSRHHRPLSADSASTSFHSIPPMERVKFAESPGMWKKVDYDDAGWNTPIEAGRVRFSAEMEDAYSRWWMQPRQIPHLEEQYEREIQVFRVAGMDSEPVEQAFENRFTPFTVDAGGAASIVLDAGHLTTAFVNIGFSGGRGRTVRITYTESLRVNGKKLTRDHPDGAVEGYSDVLELDGSEHTFETFWFRTLRFCRIDISAGDDDVEITGFSLASFLYPFELKGSFAASERDTSRIWDTAWRTARLCAHEHYYDCPYYEQLQYVGDTRIQALISYSVTGDCRLGRQAIEQFDRSRIPEGLTQSRYPSYWTQIIPGFSLFWTMMVHDYYMYFGDEDFVRVMLPGIQSVLDWFERRRTDTGIIGHCNYWNFWDWVDGWTNGSPARGEDLPITLYSLVYAEACRLSSGLYKAVGKAEAAEKIEDRYKQTIEAVNRECVDPETGLYTDVPGRPWFSQQTNAWAIIADAVTGDAAAGLSDEIVTNTSMKQATLYFTFYLFRAWAKTGRYQHFWKALDTWESILDYHFTTFPEIPSPDTRSDCHAWSSSPMYELVSFVLGIRPGAPGCGVVEVGPHPGTLTSAEGTACMNDQTVSAAWRIEDGVMHLNVVCERETPVRIVWPNGEAVDAGRIVNKKFEMVL